MRVLVLGGTRFIGRWTVARLLADGHDVTLLHRGETGRDLFPGARRLLGPRERIADLLPRDAEWDAVLDTNGYRPADVEATARAVAGRARRYAFVSSLSAYRAVWSAHPPPGAPPIREDDALEPWTAEDDSAGGPSGGYGPRKAGCERALAAACAGAGMDLLVARPVLVYGPHDYTERVHDWIRWARAGEVPAPESANVIPMVYARDAAAALAAMATREDAPTGAYNLSEPVTRTIPEWLDALAEATSARFARRSVPTEEALPLSTGAARLEVDVARATRHLGLPRTPVVDALRETMAALDERDRAR